MADTVGYVLIQTAPGRALEAATALAQIPGIKAAHPVTGVYDIICQVEAASLDDLAGTVVERIQSVDGVERTETALVVRSA